PDRSAGEDVIGTPAATCGCPSTVAWAAASDREGSMTKKLRAGLAGIAAATMLAGAAVWSSNATAHGARDYAVVEFHYLTIGPYQNYVLPYAQHIYYCDGHYEDSGGAGPSTRLAFTETLEIGGCG